MMEKHDDMRTIPHTNKHTYNEREERENEKEKERRKREKRKEKGGAAVESLTESKRNRHNQRQTCVKL